MFSLQRPSVSRCYFHLCPFLDWRLPYRVEISSECPQAPVVVFACLPCHPGLFLLPPLVLQGKDIDCRGLSLSQCPSNEYLGSKIGQQVQRNGATKILTILTLDSLDVKIAPVILSGPQGHRTRHQEGGRLKHVGSPGLVSHVISFLLDKVVGCYSPCGKLSYSIHGM